MESFREILLLVAMCITSATVATDTIRGWRPRMDQRYRHLFLRRCIAHLLIERENNWRPTDVVSSNGSARYRPCGYFFSIPYQHLDSDSLCIIGGWFLCPYAVQKKRKGDSRVKIVSMIAKVRTRSQHVQRDNVIRTRSQQFQRNKVTARSAHHIRLYAILFSYQ